MREHSDTEALPGGVSPTRPGGYILVIDDERMILDILYELLHDDEGYEVVAAESGDEALRAPTEPAPALILMDVRLLGEDSEPIARALRARPGWDAAALIVCSGIDDIDDAERRLGAQGHLAKPFDVDDVLALANEWVGPGKSGSRT
ncbi:MAG TPA: response regulator [Ktedonobacterales bacterium]